MFSRSNVNEEYMQAFRTKSYLDMWSKAQSQIERREEECHSSSPFPPCFHLSDFLLEPQQETLLAMINDSQPHTLVLDYFNGSLEACRICDFLLHCITQMRTNYHIIQTVLQHTKQAKGNYTDEQCQFITAAFMSFAKLENPLSGPSSVDFQQTHDLYGSMLKKLMSKCRKLKRKVKVINICKKATGLSLVAGYGALTALTIVLAHTFIGLVAIPIVIGYANPFLKYKFINIKKFKERSLVRLAQLDAAGKGAYILDRDFDTIGRLTTRLCDEINHNKAIVEMCLGTGNKSLLKEVVKELRNNESCFLEHLDELEEHLYLCFLTINKARRLVIKEMAVNHQHSS
eukprot:TRINITY_DN25012_c0_g1_i2.p1 TRINITY_DN25012_c0_g1~~TRINITY_DN25012_c0_g1_i2.p1  ORF type:complete len:344 (-),score=51.10 TRINITY_DN25012_c0_g1_i2:389-1420(-)